MINFTEVETKEECMYVSNITAHLLYMPDDEPYSYKAYMTYKGPSEKYLGGIVFAIKIYKHDGECGYMETNNTGIIKEIEIYDDAIKQYDYSTKTINAVKRYIDTSMDMNVFYKCKFIDDNYSKSEHTANMDVLKFIADFVYLDRLSNRGGDAHIKHQFLHGYCYYFALILKDAFNRGEICAATPSDHIVWVDTDGIPYDVTGVCKFKYECLIPISHFGDIIKDFKHVPHEVSITSKEEIVSIIDKYKKDNNIGRK
jgi:hypothetical protein